MSVCILTWNNLCWYVPICVGIPVQLIGFFCVGWPSESMSIDILSLPSINLSFATLVITGSCWVLPRGNNSLISPEFIYNSVKTQFAALLSVFFYFKQLTEQTRFFFQINNICLNHIYNLLMRYVYLSMCTVTYMFFIF